MSNTKKTERINLRYFLRLETEWKGVNRPQKFSKRTVFLKKNSSKYNSDPEKIQCGQFTHSIFVLFISEKNFSADISFIICHPHIDDTPIMEFRYIV